jgi:hypothetical protein
MGDGEKETSRFLARENSVYYIYPLLYGGGWMIPLNTARNSGILRLYTGSSIQVLYMIYNIVSSIRNRSLIPSQRSL